MELMVLLRIIRSIVADIQNRLPNIISPKEGQKFKLYKKKLEESKISNMGEKFIKLQKFN